MSAPIRIFLVDDEPLCRNTLRVFLRADCPEARIVGEAESLAEATELIPPAAPDLLLLDVQLSDGTGFDLLDRFPEPDFKVIFTTAHDEFALRAFRYSAIDYLLKPVDPDLLLEAVRKAAAHPSTVFQEQIAQLRLNTTARSFDRITLNTGDGLLFIQTADIARLETNGNYTFAYLTNGERHLVSRNMKEFEEMLPEPAFFRINQSHLVNTARVRKFLKDDGGGYVVMHDGIKLPLARRRRDGFLVTLSNFSQPSA
jgi:two-component system LytT family response regulator